MYIYLTFRNNNSIIIIEIKRREKEEMNKYIDNVTIKEYEQINRWLKDIVEPKLKEEMQQTGEQKEYVELRFTNLKILNIIKKYKKKV